MQAVHHVALHLPKRRVAAPRTRAPQQLTEQGPQPPRRTRAADAAVRNFQQESPDQRHRMIGVAALGLVGVAAPLRAQHAAVAHGFQTATEAAALGAQQRRLERLHRHGHQPSLIRRTQKHKIGQAIGEKVASRQRRHVADEGVVPAASDLHRFRQVAGGTHARLIHLIVQHTVVHHHIGALGIAHAQERVGPDRAQRLHRIHAQQQIRLAVGRLRGQRRVAHLHAREQHLTPGATARPDRRGLETGLRAVTHRAAGLAQDRGGQSGRLAAPTRQMRAPAPRFGVDDARRTWSRCAGFQFGRTRWLAANHRHLLEQRPHAHLELSDGALLQHFHREFGRQRIGAALQAAFHHHLGRHRTHVAACIGGPDGALHRHEAQTIGLHHAAIERGHVATRRRTVMAHDHGESVAQRGGA